MTPSLDGAGQVTRRLAQWAARLTLDQIPEEVLTFARQAMADGLACGIYGSTRPWVRPVQELVLEDGGRAEASLWGAGGRVPAAAAALANGTALHAIEFDDVHPEAVIHINAQALPAALAVAEALDADWDEFLVAIIAGYEVGCRVGLATGASQLARGFHPSVTSGVFGAAVAAGRLLRLSEEEMLHALGLAGTQASGLMAAQQGADVKRMHAGRAAQSGVYAARLARKGFTGIPDVLEAPYGGFGRAFGDVDDFTAAVADLGGRWHFQDITFKMYPCCGSSHTAIDGYRELCAAHPEVAAERDPEITVHATQATVNHVGWEYQPGRGATAAQMNLGYCLAAVVRDRRLTLTHFDDDQLDRPDVLEQVGRIRVVHEPEFDRYGRDGRHTVRVVVRTGGGPTFETVVRHPSGSRHHPPSTAELRAKFEGLTAPVLGETAAARLWRQVQEGAPRVRSLIAMLTPEGGGA